MKMNSEDFNDVILTNINSTFYCSQFAFSMMMRKKPAEDGGGSGRIINIASIVGQIGNIGQVNYATSKGGILAMTKTLAKEYAMRNVCVNAICPGYIESEMVRGMSAKDPQESQEDANQERIEKLIQSIPLRRLGKASEVASLVSFLSLDSAGGYMTGHCLNIDGGVAIGAT
jgi:3-oxoacyl-[acyl-carrier protein] reductase